MNTKERVVVVQHVLQRVFSLAYGDSHLHTRLFVGL